jgi:hypothetical protein
MRTPLLSLLLVSALASLPGCVIKQADDGAAGAAGSSAGSSGAAGSAAGSGGSGQQAGAAGAAAGSGGSGQSGAAGAAAGSGGSGQSGSAGAAGQAGGAGAAGSTGSEPVGNGQCQDNSNDPNPCGEVPLTGVCGDASTVRLCVVPDSPCEKAKIVEKKCPAGWSCEQSDLGAQCKNPGECVEGDRRCKGDSSIETCNGGKWVEALCPGGSICLAAGGYQAQCGLGPEAQAGVTYPLKGNLQYEFKLPNDDRTGMGPIQTDGAFYMLVSAWNGDEFVGSTISDGEGDFTIAMTLPPSANLKVYAFPMSFTYDGTRPLSAVAHVAKSGDQFDPDNDTAPNYWFYQYQGATDENTTQLGDWTVTEAQGSGAIWIFQWMEFGYRRMHDLYPEAPQMSAVTFWDEGVKFDCGACFHPPGLGSPRVDLGNGEFDNYDTRFSFTGTQGTPKQWQRSSIGHEFGHYVMSNYSLSPSEGGSHGLQDQSKPGLAYSEGWATFFGQRNMSDPEQGVLENVYFSVAGDTYWWYDLDKVADSNSSVPKADPAGSLDQPLSEALVTSMIWNLWAPPADGLLHKNLGDVPVFSALSSERTRNASLNRGYKRVDYVDYADGFSCTSPDSAGNIDEVSQLVGHPYQSSGKVCQLERFSARPRSPVG